MTDVIPNQDDENLFSYRIGLDKISMHQVEWMPYGQLDFETSHLRVSQYHGPISCLSISEPYMPDRVSRQFGRVQCIPRAVILPKRAHKPTDPARYNVTYPRAEWAWTRRHSTHTITLEQMGPPVITPFDCHEDYLRCYYPLTHVMVCHPNHEVMREHRG